MKYPEYYSYTAIFSRDGDGWQVEFPDLNRCATNAETLEEAILQATNILEDYMAILERDGRVIPEARLYEDIEVPEGCIKQLIVVSMRDARQRWSNQTVRKTVTLPVWIVNKALSSGLNLSQELQTALMKKIKVVY